MYQTGGRGQRRELDTILGVNLMGMSLAAKAAIRLYAGRRGEHCEHSFRSAPSWPEATTSSMTPPSRGGGFDTWPGDGHGRGRIRVNAVCPAHSHAVSTNAASLPRQTLDDYQWPSQCSAPCSNVRARPGSGACVLFLDPRKPRTSRAPVYSSMVASRPSDPLSRSNQFLYATNNDKLPSYATLEERIMEVGRSRSTSRTVLEDCAGV